MTSRHSTNALCVRTSTAPAQSPGERFTKVESANSHDADFHVGARGCHRHRVQNAGESSRRATDGAGPARLVSPGVTHRGARRGRDPRGCPLPSDAQTVGLEAQPRRKTNAPRGRSRGASVDSYDSLALLYKRPGGSAREEDKSAISTLKFYILYELIGSPKLKAPDSSGASLVQYCNDHCRLSTSAGPRAVVALTAWPRTLLPLRRLRGQLTQTNPRFRNHRLSLRIVGEL